MKPLASRKPEKDKHLFSAITGVLGALLIGFAITMSFVDSAFAARADGGYTKNEIKQIIVQEAERDGVVPVALALAVARVESNFNAMAKSHVGARGVMQIMPATAKGEFGVAADRLWNPRLNIRLGIRFLHQLYNQYGNKWDLALSHYNGGTLKGRGANAIPHSYTRKYVKKVTKFWRQYARSEIVLASAEVKDAITVSSKSKRFTWEKQGSTHVTDTYWLLEEPKTDRNWREYLEAADRILEGELKEERIFDGYDYLSSADNLSNESSNFSTLRKKFQDSLKRVNSQLNVNEKKRFM
ncbi:lytic transglycosylase domain-containing protein [Curvivirga aplysinae]|uniref:lytic transglycosylase domain-containing protein n=1 Tax=Curvivirga aplysinae TaxID=2529852 RepID=UPI0012BC7006|nr:lytic transglycosylase domain-containing protein [Curvivirga aplysinae]MTI08730.1 lytic transglycosylase domain-containing protein [Curvivirga aplysinae]